MRRGSRKGRGSLIVLSVGLFQLALLAQPESPVLDSGLVERTRVSLMLLDVNVLGQDGEPLRGLTRDDFVVRVDGELWPLVSVDDLCRVPPAAADATADGPASQAAIGAAGRPDEPAPPEDSGAATTVPPPSERRDAPRFVLYLDFAQLQADGRVLALESAKRWVREVMRSGDEVTIVGYTTRRGVRTIQPFTRDREALLATLEAAEGDLELSDPFAQALPLRIKRCCSCCDVECDVGCGSCGGCLPCLSVCLYEGARAEHSHARRSLEAFRDYLIGLERIDGRKTLLLFSQSGSLRPARFYPVNEDRVGDVVRLVDDLGAEANLSRATIHTLVGATNLGANLADFTGGSYVRPLQDEMQVLRGTRAEAACIYRLGLEPPEEGGSRPRRVRVEVRGRPLEHRYLVKHLDEGERWLRDALVVLRDPAAAMDVPLTAAVVPVAAGQGGWEVEVQVSLDTDALVLLPRGDKFRGDWEVGALLTRNAGAQSWEMLGVSQLMRTSEEKSGVAVLHRRAFANLKPGSYELRAFVRDRVANLYGAVGVELELPRPGRPELGGPLLFRAGARLFPTLLPLRRETPVASPARATVLGELPAGDGAVTAGEPLSFMSWVCSPDGEPAESLHDIARWIEREGEPFFRFADPTLQPAGRCALLRDDLEAAPSEAGSYTYNVRWRPDGEERSRSIAFEVAPSVPAPESR